ncbi:voltage-gated monoatomic cation channel TMEM109 [Chroicocephalus ridibundus]|uniref:voltage-gated monoatomic cation channel TMEM109 n=1 Tax=Chroicocephalus ridibundus TaxID=1192867 RepID=UPI002FDDAC8B
MEGVRGGRRALLALLLGVPLLGVAAAAAAGGGDRAEDEREDGFPGATAGDDPLSRLGQAAWAATESWLGPQPLRLVAETLSATLWVVSSGISVALTTFCRILGDLLATTGHSGDRLLLRTVALAPAEVQRVLLWGLAAAAASWLLARLRGLLLPLLRWAKLCCFLAAFLHVATCRESPTTQAGLLLGLWVLYGLLGGGLVAPAGPSPQLEAALRSLEWKVEELRRRQRWGGPRNREE